MVVLHILYLFSSSQETMCIMKPPERLPQIKHRYDENENVIKRVSYQCNVRGCISLRRQILDQRIL